MHLTKSGKLPKYDDWWIGQRVICPDCAAEGVLEVGDTVRRHRRRPGVKCPTVGCKAYMRTVGTDTDFEYDPPKGTTDAP